MAAKPSSNSIVSLDLQLSRTRETTQNSVKSTDNWAVYHFDFKLTISSIVQIWSLTPATIAGVLG